MSDLDALILVLQIVFTPVIVLITMWVKGFLESTKTKEKREDYLLGNVMERVKLCEERHAAREKEIREIRVELKNRDVEYVNLYQEHATLKAKYEILLADHDELKKNFENTVNELEILKEDIKRRAEAASKIAIELEKKSKDDKGTTM